MSSRRCTICNLNVKNIAVFADCPVCGTRTWPDPYVDPTPVEEMSDEQVEALDWALSKHKSKPTPADQQVSEFASWLDTVNPDDFVNFPSSRQ